MVRFSLVSLILLVSCSQPTKKSEEVEVKAKNREKKFTLKELEAEYKEVDSIPYLESYIERVIIEGSSSLGFKSGAMQGGFVDKDTAKMIAHYVVELSGKDCTDHQMAKKAQMYYTSNCGGCHGDDGKGLGGAFPDLTRDRLLGIEKRREFLRYEIEKLKR